MDIFEKLRGMDKKDLASAIKKAQDFAKTDEGKAFVEKIKKGEAGLDKETQEKLIREIGENPSLAKKLSDLMKG